MPKTQQKKNSSEVANPQQFEVIVDEQNQAARFANSVKIWHTPYEFYMDFGQFIPGTNKIKLNSRIVITPQHASNLHAALTENLSKYEQRFGKIYKTKPQKDSSNAKKDDAEYVG